MSYGNKIDFFYFIWFDLKNTKYIHFYGLSFHYDSSVVSSWPRLIDSGNKSH